MNIYIFEVLFIILCIACLVPSYWLYKKPKENVDVIVSEEPKKSNFAGFIKKYYTSIFTILFALIGTAYTFSYYMNCMDIVTLNGSPLSPVLTAVSSILIWCLVATFSLIITNEKFKDIKIIRIFVKWFAPIILILCAIYIDPIHVFLTNQADGLKTIVPALYLYSTMLGIGLYVVGLNWLKYPFIEKLSKKEIFYLILAFLGILFVSIPSWLPQVLFGTGYYRWNVKSLTADHRAFILLAFIMPFLVYIPFKNSNQNTRNAVLLLISMSTLINFNYKYYYASFTSPWSLPFHLCNMAMYLIPICIIFGTKRLFYFTYFINVFGALMAMLMPNYDTQPILTEWIIYFWLNHWCAFGMPLLCVSMGMFARPKMKQMWYSLIWFTVYFVLMLFLNAYFKAMGKDTDFFFLNSDFIVNKFGTWAENLFKIDASLKINGLTLVFHPMYQLAFFGTYVGIAFAMWYVYILFYHIADSHRALYEKNRKIRLDHYALMAQLNGRSLKEPMEENAGTVLKINHFSKRYGRSDVYAVKDESLSVNGGEIFGFLGPNGAGKSTTIKCIVGIQTLTEGSISICGYDVTKQSVEAKRLTGYVPDHYALYEKLTGREYINFIADIYDVPSNERTERINYYIDLFHLEDAFDSTISTYSHGMKQKITIIAALIHNPKLWILDEPLTGLDPDSIFQVKECMRHHASQGNIVMFSSHLIDVVENLCNRIVIIRKGHIGTPITIEDVHKISSLEDYYMNSTKTDIQASKVENDVDSTNKVKKPAKPHKFIFNHHVKKVENDNKDQTSTK